MAAEAAERTRFAFDDGGRLAAGFAPAPDGDCVARALSIALELPYRRVYAALRDLIARDGASQRLGLNSPDDGVLPHLTNRYLLKLGWRYVFNRAGVLTRDMPPFGRYVLWYRWPEGPGHLAAVVDGSLRDISDGMAGAPPWGFWWPRYAPDHSQPPPWPNAMDYIWPHPLPLRSAADIEVAIGPRQDWVGVLRPQLAETWPLPGALAQMRWRPGDGIRVRDPDINVYDTAPRQILTFTRNLLPNGLGSATVSVANRPRSAAHTLKRQLYAVSRLQRNYQKQLVTLTGSQVAATLTAGASGLPGPWGPASVVSLSPGDQVVRAYLRVTYNSAAVPFGVGVGTGPTTETGTLNGPWTVVPAAIDLGGVYFVDPTYNKLYVSLQIASGTTNSQLDYQVLVDVLR